jgi:tRNA pseudouridine55 synthase
MAKRHKGNKVDGWVVIDKPAGVTSIKAVSKARWAFRAG